jgi:hypothetical protein
MSGPKLTQTELLNVLVAEIESFKSTKKAYSNIAQENSQHLKRLEELYNKPISVDTETMQEEHARIQQTLRQGLYIPKWIGITLLCLIIGFSISVAFNYKQYVINKDQNQLIEYAKSYIEKLEKEQKLLKPKSKT